MQINLELRTPVGAARNYLAIVCEYFTKYSWLCPWLFKWPDYGEEYTEEGGEQDVYDN